MPPESTTRWPAHTQPDGPTSRSAWSMRFGAHLRRLGMDVMPLEAMKIGATLYEHSEHLSPEDAAVLYAADHHPGHGRPDA
jgi:hypothetical protein